MKLGIRFVTLTAAATAIGFTALHAEAALEVDRGLPDSNLNNAASSDRSNVAWGFAGDFLAGDDFTLGSTGDPNLPNWHLDKVRVWVVAGAVGDDLGDTFNSLSLFLGSDPASVPKVMETNISGNSSDNSAVSISQVQYANGDDYQGSSGSFLNIWQVDFDNVGSVAPGTQLFALGGTPSGDDNPNPFMHASNAALSGTPQEGSDDLYRWFSGNGASTSITAGGTIDSNGNGWDKSSDINVQVFASPIPSPTAALGALGIAGLGLLRRRRA